MGRPKGFNKDIIEARNSCIIDLTKRGYSQTEIADVFFLHRSLVSRLAARPSVEEESEVQLCMRWIKETQKVQKTINRMRTSYGLKHVVERYYKTYVGNEEFKEAIRRLDVPYELFGTNGVNYQVGLAEANIKKTEHETDI